MFADDKVSLLPVLDEISARKKTLNADLLLDPNLFSFNVVL